MIDEQLRRMEAHHSGDTQRGIELAAPACISLDGVSNL